MSLKSFDKFCENLILAPENPKYREKEIYDERQNQVRQKLITEALLVYAAAALINTWVMDRIYQWCSSYFAPMIVLATACYLYWILRCKAKGCLFGVGSSYNTKWSGYIMIFESIMLGFLSIENVANGLEEGKYLFINNGMIEGRVLLVLVFPIIGIMGIITVILAKKHIKETEEAEKN